MNVVRNVFLMLCVVVALVLLAGCSKDDGGTQPSTNDPSKAQERVGQANQIFIPKLVLLVNSGTSDSASLDFSSATSLYREALSLDPSNTNARFGIALTEMLTMSSDRQIREMFGNLNLGNLNNLLYLGNWRYGLGTSPFTTARLVEMVRTGSGSYPGADPFGYIKHFKTVSASQPFSYYQNIIETKVYPILTDADAQMKAIVADPNFAFYVTPAQVGGNIGDSIRIDRTEIYALMAVASIARAELAFMLTYNADFDNTTAAGTASMWDPSSSFLGLRPTGASFMHEARAGILEMADAVKSGITSLRSETAHPGTDLIRYNSADDAKFADVVRSMDSLYNYLNNPQTLQFSANTNAGTVQKTLTINLKAFFETPITNFKQKMPGYTVATAQSGSGKYDAILTWQAANFNAWVFPDPTMNGLFPGMTDAGFKDFFGITSNGWTSTVTIH